MKILFVQTGGSIDKTYPKIRGYKFEIDEPAVKKILKKVHPNFEYELVTVLRKDSRDMTEEDRQKIYDFCKKCIYDKIIITHGTDTMVQTARKLGSIKDKLIVLTGAMLPEKFSDSDAMFNVGTAVGALNVLDKGVYLVMNGRVYHWDDVKEDLKHGKFVEE